MNLIKEVKSFFYKPGTTEWHREKIVSIILLVTLLLLLFFYGQKRNNRLTAERKTNARYTIGTTIKSHRNFRSSQPTVDYWFVYSGNRYEDFEKIPDTLEDKIVTTKGKYYVEFSSIDPTNSQLLLDCPVPDTVSIVEDSGWIHIPTSNHPR